MEPRPGAWAVLLVGLLAAVNFGVGLDSPRAPIWDESYYLTAVGRYREGVAQFASHPPLGLMLIAAGDRISGSHRPADPGILGRSKSLDAATLPPGFSFEPMRIASAVFATLGAMGFFLLMYAVTHSTFSALAFSNLFTFENAFVTQFRAAHLDAFQLAFTVSALLCFVRAVQRDQRSAPLLEVGFGVSCGLAMMVKLNSSILILFGVMLLARRTLLRWRNVPVNAPLHATRCQLLWQGWRDAAIMGVSCLAAMAVVFAIHLRIGSHEVDARTPAGQRDQLFISAPYRNYLDEKLPLTPTVFVSAAQDYGRYMAADFTGITRVDHNGSVPLYWPIGAGTINYRWDSDGARTSYVQLVGNKAGWLLALAAPFAVAALLIQQWRSPLPASQPARRSLMAMLLIGYIAFMISNQYLSTLRVMYLYHYFTGLLFAFLMLPLVLEEAAQRWPYLRRRRSQILGWMSAIVLCSFVFYAPLNYHRPLTHSQCESRNLFQHVIDCRP